MTKGFTLVHAAGWENWLCEADSWDDVWALVTAMHRTQAIYLSIQPRESDDRLFVVGNTHTMWLVTLVQSEPPFKMDVYGGKIDIRYDTNCLDWVQLEQTSAEDPAPAGFWLPGALALNETEAGELAAQLLRVTETAGEIESSRLVMFPAQIAGANG